MKTSLTLLLFTLIGTHSFAQQKYFEGVLTHHVTVTPEVSYLDGEYFRRTLGAGEPLTIYIKDGNYRHHSDLCDIYYRQKEKRVFYKYPHLDTLYYKDYNQDTSQVKELVKSDSMVRVNNIECRSLSITTATGTSQFFYAPSLFNNPDYDRDNTLGHFDLYTRETGGRIWLMLHAELGICRLVDSCIRVEEKEVDPHQFDLPDLPVVKYNLATMAHGPQFPGGETAWSKYLRTHIKRRVPRKYFKFTNGESLADLTVAAHFMVMEDGWPGKIEIEDKEKFHPKLIEEVTRVIQGSPRWTAGTIYGEKAAYPVKAFVVFENDEWQ